MKFVVFEDHLGEWRFRLVAGNGEPMAASEGYTRKADAIRAAKRLKSEVYRAPIVVTA